MASSQPRPGGPASPTLHRSQQTGSRATEPRRQEENVPARERRSGRSTCSCVRTCRRRVPGPLTARRRLASLGEWNPSSTRDAIPRQRESSWTSARGESPDPEGREQRGFEAALANYPRAALAPQPRTVAPRRLLKNFRYQ